MPSKPVLHQMENEEDLQFPAMLQKCEDENAFVVIEKIKKRHLKKKLNQMERLKLLFVRT